MTTRFDQSNIDEMRKTLRDRGYDPKHAIRLYNEGMRGIELEHRLTTTSPGSVGSLEYTHGIYKKVIPQNMIVRIIKEIAEETARDMLDSGAYYRGMEGTFDIIPTSRTGLEISSKFKQRVGRKPQKAEYLATVAFVMECLR